MEFKEKLQRTFVRDEAYVLLRDWIVEGKLQPNQKLRDKELAEQLGISRTPIREALLRLEEEGLIKTKPNASTVVCPIDLKDAWHLYSIALALEKLALAQAFDAMTTEHIQLMSEANQRLLKALKENQRLLAVEADNDFHSVFVQLSKNNELQRILSSVKYKLKRLELYYFEHIQEASTSCEEHKKIIEALQKKDLLLALHALELNWTTSFSRIQHQG